MSRFINRKRAAVVGLVASVVVAGAAFAFFTSNGTGSGTATVGKTNNSWAVTVTPDTTNALYPTGLGKGPAASLPFTVKNTTSGYLRLNNLVISLKTAPNPGVAGESDIADSAGKAVAGCLASWFSVDGTGNPIDPTPTAVPLSYTAPGATSSSPTTYNMSVEPAGTLSGTASIQLIDSSANQDACQGAVPTLAVTTTSTTGS